MEPEVEDRRPLGRPKKTWSKVVEDMRKLNIVKDNLWQRIDISGGDTYHIRPQEWETSDFK